MSSSTSITYTMDRSSVRDVKMKIVPTPTGEHLPWRDPEFGPWFFGYSVLRDVETHWPYEQWRNGGWEEAGEKGSLARICRLDSGGGSATDSMRFVFSLKLPVRHCTFVFLFLFF